MPRVSEIAAFLQSSVTGGDFEIEKVVPISAPEPRCLTFLSKMKPAWRERLDSTSPLAALVPPGLDPAPRCSYIEVANPRLAIARVLARFWAPKAAPAIAPTAVIHPAARLGEGVSVGHFAYIGAGVVIGDGSEIRERAVIYDRTIVGRRCVIKAGAVLGEEGFGIEFDEQLRPVRIPHIGHVELGDDVEIGCNSIVARATLGVTRIADRVKIDDLSIVAHNCSIGEDSLVCGLVAMSGSVTIGKRCWIGPQTGLLQSLRVADDSLLGLGAIVLRDVAENVVVSGYPAKVLGPRRETATEIQEPA
jgi:UDP-3-O-[3-hydroxymyristoyl] glucosamine N-acyltransferase